MLHANSQYSSYVADWIDPYLLTKPEDSSKDYKNKLCSTKPSMKFIIPINVKMPTTFGILTFIRMRFESKKSLFFSILVLWVVEISCLVEVSIKGFITLGPGLLATKYRLTKLFSIVRLHELG